MKYDDFLRIVGDTDSARVLSLPELAKKDFESNQHKEKAQKKADNKNSSSTSSSSLQSNDLIIL